MCDFHDYQACRPNFTGNVRWSLLLYQDGVSSACSFASSPKQRRTLNSCPGYVISLLLLSHSVLTPCDPHGLQHARPPCPSPTPGACSNSRPSSQWCHPSTSSSIVPFPSCLQSSPAPGSLLTSRLFSTMETPRGSRDSYEGTGANHVCPAYTGHAE